MHEGLILALVSICVVFAALFLLYLFYGLMGEIFMRGASKPSPSEAVSAPAADDEEGARRAAAIAVALELQNRRTLTLQPGIFGWKSPEYSFRKMVNIDKNSSYKGAQNCGGLPSATIYPDRVAKQQGAEGF